MFCQAEWKAAKDAGVFDSRQYPELGYTPCEDGLAEAIPGDAKNTFRCQNVRHSATDAETLFANRCRLTSTTSSAMLHLAVRAVQDHRPGDGHLMRVASSSPSASMKVLLLSRSTRMGR